MVDQRILSSEEVEALLQASKPSDATISTEGDEESTASYNEKEFGNIIDSLRTELSKTFTSLLRKKIVIKANQPQVVTNKEFIETQENGRLMSNYIIEPFNSTMLLSLDFNLIYQTINLLYGGKLEQEAQAQSHSGKIGMILGEKINAIIIDSFQNACVEHKAISYDHHKTSSSVARINSLPDHEKMVISEMVILYDDIEFSTFISIPEEMLIKLLPVNTNTAKHREKDFWRKAIKSEVMDSMVTISITLNDVKKNLTDVTQLQAGSEIEIDDPTSVYVCLNNYKLFHAVAGESNDKLVAKVIKQI